MANAFVGPLSRFFARQQGDPALLRAGVEAWRRDLRDGVAVKVGEQLVWDEGADVAVEFDLGAAGWTALRLLAFYAEHSELEWPDTVPLLCEFEPQWREAAEQKFAKSLYGQLLACELWLPGEFPVTIRAPRPDGQDAEIGSLQVLHEQLQWLNQRTFQADREVSAGWREQPADVGAPFVAAAQRGFAAMQAAVEAARAAGAPLVVTNEVPPAPRQG
ncbi:MAG: hypothetical protein H6835_04285 [Planctomycetes bacterium]|nr:hypothetical protein [Planctomycetota bacterium]